MKLFVPGRICLLGEHSDWAGGYRRINAEIEKGYAIICGTNQGIYAEVDQHPNKLVLTATSPGGEVVGPYEIAMDPQVLLEEAQKRGLPGSNQLPRPRAGIEQLQDRLAHQERSLLQRRDLRPGGPCF
jgi:hypothetical protein